MQILFMKLKIPCTVVSNIWLDMKLKFAIPVVNIYSNVLFPPVLKTAIDQSQTTMTLNDLIFALQGKEIDR